jgi:hypothetical protein
MASFSSSPNSTSSSSPNSTSSASDLKGKWLFAIREKYRNDIRTLFRISENEWGIEEDCQKKRCLGLGKGLSHCTKDDEAKPIRVLKRGPIVAAAPALKWSALSALHREDEIS